LVVISITIEVFHLLREKLRLPRPGATPRAATIVAGDDGRHSYSLGDR